MPGRSGRHFLQIPGPTNLPERVLRAMDRSIIDHRGPEFQRLTHQVLDGLQHLCQTAARVVVYPASGSGAWEAAVVNTLSPGDRALAFDHGVFANGWSTVASRYGVQVEVVPVDWRHAVSAQVVEDKLRADNAQTYKAVFIVHNETSTGVTNSVQAMRGALDATRHPALLMVDTVSSLGSLEYRHDDWGVDVMVGGSQKGLMLPPGLGFNVVSEKALRASAKAVLPRAYWDWAAMLAANADGVFPYTPATNLLFGLRETLHMLREDGLEQVWARHTRLAEATRRAVQGWGLDLFCAEARARSNSLTAVLMPEGVDADRLRDIVLERFDMSLGAGLGKLRGQVLRIGHLGDFNELMLAGALCGVEMGLRLADVPLAASGVSRALEFLADASR